VRAEAAESDAQQTRDTKANFDMELARLTDRSAHDRTASTPTPMRARRDQRDTRIGTLQRKLEQRKNDITQLRERANVLAGRDGEAQVQLLSTRLELLRSEEDRRGAERERQRKNREQQTRAEWTLLELERRRNQLMSQIKAEETAQREMLTPRAAPGAGKSRQTSESSSPSRSTRPPSPNCPVLDFSSSDDGACSHRAPVEEDRPEAVPRQLSEKSANGTFPSRGSLGPPPKAKAPEAPAGKGQGKGPPPPPKEVNVKGKGKGAPSSRKTGPKLVRIHWKDVDKGDADPAYVMKMAEFLHPDGEAVPVMHITDIEREIGMIPDREEDSPRVYSPAHSKKRKRHTIFADFCRVRELSEGQLSDYFAARTASLEIAKSTCEKKEETNMLITNRQDLQSLDILVGQRKVKRQIPAEAAVEELVSALKACSYEEISTEVLGQLQKVIEGHLQDSLTVIQFVEAKGVAELATLKNPHIHLLLYGALRIPGISARLDCMRVESTFNENVRKNFENLRFLDEGLRRLASRLGPLQCFFSAAMSLGNALNKGSGPIARYGFKLSSLKLFSSLKSSCRRDVSLFHMVIVLMPEAEAAELIQDDVDVMLRAKQARIYNVQRSVLQLLEGHGNVAELVRTGKYMNQEIPRCTDTDPPDNFHSTMANLVRRSVDQVAEIRRVCIGVVQAYRSLSAFFCDKSLYPAPKDDQDPERYDLFDVFHTFLDSFVKARKEVVEWQLAADLSSEWTLAVRTSLARSSLALSTNSSLTARSSLSSSSLLTTESSSALCTSSCAVGEETAVVPSRPARPVLEVSSARRQGDASMPSRTELPSRTEVPSVAL